MKFTDMLQHCWDVNQSLLCVGLDPDPKRFPKQFGKQQACHPGLLLGHRNRPEIWSVPLNRRLLTLLLPARKISSKN